MEKNYKIGDKTFVLDQTKAEEAFNSKKIINGKDTMFFNILPLKYQWAYDLYKTMKNNHWEPEDIPMQKDVELWRSADLQMQSAGSSKWRLAISRLPRASSATTYSTSLVSL